MRRIFLYTATGLLSALLLSGSGAAAAQVPSLQPDKEVCTGDFGTAVHFLKTPSEAAKQALKEQKLVFVLHVSGDFEDPDFT
ncbi:MAG TPA: hypothetical protein VKI65_09135 [Gemmataceae bacterium]|nr:hypothetical protein [Gemmataceae bacterium]